MRIDDHALDSGAQLANHGFTIRECQRDSAWRPLGQVECPRMRFIPSFGAHLDEQTAGIALLARMKDGASKRVAIGPDNVAVNLRASRGVM